MSAADIRQGKNWSTRDLAYKLRIIADAPNLKQGDKAVVRAAADRLEMLKSKLDGAGGPSTALRSAQGDNK